MLGVSLPPQVLPNAPLVPIASTIWDAIKYPMKIWHHTQNIRLCTCPRPQQFYAQENIPFGVPFIGTWKYIQKRKLGISCTQCIEFGHVNGTTSGFQCVQKTHNSWKYFRHIILQAQVSHLPNCGSRRYSRIIHQKTNIYSHRKLQEYRVWKNGIVKTIGKSFKKIAKKNAKEVADKQQKTIASKLTTDIHNQG